MKPSIFIASSVEGLKVAQALQELLRFDADCQLWTQDAFEPSAGTMESLLNLVGENDFGVFIFSPDDKVDIREKRFECPRDNVVFETGLFMGQQGRDSVFVVKPETLPIRLPSDFEGFTCVPYDPNHSRGLAAGTAVAARRISESIEKSTIARRLRIEASLLVAGPSEKRNFPIKIWLDVQNLSSTDVVLHSGVFRFAKGMRPHPKLLLSAAGAEAELLFPSSGGHTQHEFLLKGRTATSTFTALDPKVDATRANDLLQGQKIGKFCFKGTWLGDRPVRRNYELKT